MKKVLLLLNPRSRRGGECFEEAQQWLLDRQYHILNSKDELAKISFEKLIDRYASTADLVFVGGGDGSVNAALPALVRHQLPLVVLPLGTANNLARTLGIPSNLASALELSETGERTTIDLGVVNGIYFANVVGLGLSTQVNQLVHKDMKRFFGVGAFIMATFGVARRMRPFTAWIECDGQKHFSRSWQLSVCNGRHYGSGLVIQEEATLDDGRLHALSTEIKKWWHGFFLIPSMLMGRYRADQDVTTFEGKRIRVSTRRSLRVDVDGDIKTRTPLEIHVERDALSIFVPTAEKS